MLPATQFPNVFPSRRSRSIHKTDTTAFAIITADNVTTINDTIMLCFVPLFNNNIVSVVWDVERI